MTGPIFNLRFFGLLCPCMEKDEDKNARVSLNQLNRLGACVDWHPVAQPSNTGVGQGIRRFFSGQKNESAAVEGGGPPIPSQLKLVDATKDTINHGEPYAELQLRPLPQKQRQQGGDQVTHSVDDNLQDDDPELGGGGLQRASTPKISLDIPLHHVLRVEDSATDPTMLLLHTKDIHSVDDQKKNQKVAARLGFLTQDVRDKISLDLKLLVEWHKHKQPHIEEDIPAEGIRARAQKAAHFARREIEMRETKRTREQRKAKYVQESGGLKYTAVAMASRATVS